MDNKSLIIGFLAGSLFTFIALTIVGALMGG